MESTDPAVKSAKVKEDKFLPIKDFRKKVKLVLTGDTFFQSPPVMLRNVTNDGEKDVTKEVKGVAHELHGKLYFSTPQGEGLFNVTHFSPIS